MEVFSICFPHPTLPCPPHSTLSFPSTSIFYTFLFFHIPLHSLTLPCILYSSLSHLHILPTTHFCIHADLLYAHSPQPPLYMPISTHPCITPIPLPPHPFFHVRCRGGLLRTSILVFLQICFIYPKFFSPSPCTHPKTPFIKPQANMWHIQPNHDMWIYPS